MYDMHLPDKSVGSKLHDLQKSSYSGQPLIPLLLLSSDLGSIQCSLADYNKNTTNETEGQNVLLNADNYSVYKPDTSNQSLSRFKVILYYCLR